MKQSVILIGIRLQIHNIGKIQNPIKEILQEVILIVGAESGFNDKAFLPTAKKAHHISGTETVIYSLKDHLSPCNIVRILNKLREHEDTFSFKLLQRLVGNLVRKIRYWGEGIPNPVGSCSLRQY